MRLNYKKKQLNNLKMNKDNIIMKIKNYKKNVNNNKNN